MPDLEQQAKSQALYMQQLLIKARAIATKQKNPLFDPQGRILVGIRLNEQEKNDALKAMEGEFESLNAALGRTIPDKTIVSLDITHQPELKAKYESTLKKALKDNNAPEFGTQYIEALNQTKTGSMIPLQQEFRFHLHLAARTYRKIGVGNKSKKRLKQLKLKSISL